MARDHFTAEEFDAIARDLSDASDVAKAIAAMLRDNNMPSALIHGSTTANRYLPAVLEWVDKTNADVKAQLRAYLAGVESRAEIHKRQNENQKKLAAAKKPWTKKAAKKKPE